MAPTGAFDVEELGLEVDDPDGVIPEVVSEGDGDKALSGSFFT